MAESKEPKRLVVNIMRKSLMDRNGLIAFTLLVVMVVAGPATGQTEPPQLLEKIISNKVTKADMIAGFSQHNVGDLATIASFAVRARGNPEIVDFIRTVWRGDDKKYPSLAWQEIKQPRVRIMLAQTLGQIDEHNQEYYDYIKSSLSADDERVRATAAIALGMVGSDKDIPTLTNLSKSSSAIISTHAIHGLGILGTEKSKQALAKLKTEMRSDSAKEAAIESALDTNRRVGSPPRPN